jgi:hypothetical protein
VTALLDEIELDSSRCFFAGVEFNVPLVHGGTTIQCYYDKEWVEIDGNESGVSVHQPTALIHLADDPTIVVNEVVTVDGIDYTVRDIQQDRGETGDVLLVLSV